MFNKKMEFSGWSVFFGLMAVGVLALTYIILRDYGPSTRPSAGASLVGFALFMAGLAVALVVQAFGAAIRKPIRRAAIQQIQQDLKLNERELASLTFPEFNSEFDQGEFTTAHEGIELVVEFRRNRQGDYKLVDGSAMPRSLPAYVEQPDGTVKMVDRMEGQRIARSWRP